MLTKEEKELKYEKLIDLRSEYESLSEKYLQLKRIRCGYFHNDGERTYAYTPLHVIGVDPLSDTSFSMRDIIVPEDAAFEVVDAMLKSYKKRMKEMSTKIRAFELLVNEVERADD